MQKLLIILAAVALSSCTFKKVENHYFIQSGVSVIHQGGQSVSGSDAEDSLNGNEPAVNLNGSAL